MVWASVVLDITSKMFKFVVLCAFVAASVAEPEPQLPVFGPLVQPYSAYSTLVSPATTSISSSSSSVIHPSPYNAYAGLPFIHALKKRSPQFPALAYNYYPNLATPYISTAPVVHTPVTYASPALPIAAHLIKKRSAEPQFPIPTSYYTPTTYVSSPGYTTPVVSTPYLQTPYYNEYPLLSAHLIKKRSADPQFFPSTYLASPYSSYYNTIASTPYLTSPVVSSTVYSAPATYPLAAAHLIKKRSADPEPEPQFPLTSFYNYSPYYPATTVFKSSPFAPLSPIAPVIASNPIVYSTPFIKK